MSIRIVAKDSLKHQILISTTKQFILIVRYNPKMTQPTPEALQTNIKHWNEFMGGLGQMDKS